MNHFKCSNAYFKGTIKYVNVYTNFNEWDFNLLQWEKMNCSKTGSKLASKRSKLGNGGRYPTPNLLIAKNSV